MGILPDEEEIVTGPLFLYLKASFPHCGFYPLPIAVKLAFRNEWLRHVHHRIKSSLAFRFFVATNIFDYTCKCSDGLLLGTGDFEFNCCVQPSHRSMSIVGLLVEEIWNVKKRCRDSESVTRKFRKRIVMDGSNWRLWEHRGTVIQTLMCPRPLPRRPRSRPLPFLPFRDDLRQIAVVLTCLGSPTD